MMKNCLLALILASLALCMGCARGISHLAKVVVTTNPANQSVIAVSFPVDLTVTVDGAASTAVNWSVSSNSCTANACGTIATTAQGATYTAPITLPSGKKSMTVNVIATSNTDSAAKGQVTLTVLPITVCITPPPIGSAANTCATTTATNVGAGLVQQFTAVAIPDNLSQTFTWSLTCTDAGHCGTLTQDATTSGLAVYTAPATPPSGCPAASCVTVTATSTLNAAAPSSGSSDVIVQPSRVMTATPYAFRFSGYDTSGSRILMAGSLTFSTLGAGGAVSGATGVVDKVSGPGTASPGSHQYTITAGGYTPSALSDDSTNDAGTVTFTDSAPQTYTFRAVVSSAGQFRLIETDAHGTGSGVMELSNLTGLGAPHKFAFLLTGVDSTGKRVGAVGLLPFDGVGNISGGMIDLNDGGIASSSTNVTGTYGPVNGNLIPVKLTSLNWTFDAYIGAGQLNGKNPLTLFLASTNASLATQPALAGTMVFQDSTVTYDKTALNNNPAVSHLDGQTGSNTSATLVVSSGDSNGNITGSFDTNSGGTLVSNQSFSCTYTTDPSNKGRYVVHLLGNSSTCGGAPLPFVFYATGANRGFLLDQSSAAVLAGGMDVQGTNLAGIFAGSTLPGTYAVATVGDAGSGVTPQAANLLLTYTVNAGTATLGAGGTLYTPAASPGAAGNYTIQNTGTGTLTLTPQGAANADIFVFYAIDTTQFWLIQTQDTTGNPPANPAVLFMQQ